MGWFKLRLALIPTSVVVRTLPAADRVFVGTAVAALMITGFYDLGYFDHDDLQYGAAPLLLAHFRLYRDFSFDQTPLQAWVGLAMLKVVGPTWMYVALRLLSLLCVWSVALIGITLCKAWGSRFLFLFSFLMIDPLITIGGEIGNYSLSLLLFAAAVWFFLERPQWPFIVGLLAAASVSEKLLYAFMIPAFGIFYFNDTKSLIRFAIGTFVGLAPILFYLTRFPREFWFENVTYHYLINIYRGVGFHFALSSVLLVVALAGILVPFLNRDRLKLLALLCAAMIGLLAPGILFPQYWAPVDFSLLLIGCLAFERASESNRVVSTAIMIAAIGAAFSHSAKIISDASAQWKDDAYGIVAVQEEQTRFADALKKLSPGCHSELISAFAAAAASGVDLDSISSEGPFMMRMDGVFKSHAPWFRDYSDVSRHLKPTSLLLVGYHPGTPYENEMRRYATLHDFRDIELGRLFGMQTQLEVPPGC
jgi:hypothetical protein